MFSKKNNFKMYKGLFIIEGNQKGKEVFVLSNYRWYYEPYTLHLKQLKKENIVGKIFYLNISELKTHKNPIINYFKNKILILKLFLACKIFIVDGFIGKWLYFLTFTGLLKRKYSIATQQNFIFPELNIK